MNKPANMEQRLEALRLYDVYSARFDEWNEHEGNEDDLVAARSRLQDAWDVYDAYAKGNAVPLLLDDNDDPTTCALSKAPLVDTDQTEVVLRIALGLPLRAETDADAEGWKLLDSCLVQAGANLGVDHNDLTSLPPRSKIDGVSG